MNANQKIYESKIVVHSYSGLKKLFPAEKIIFNLIATKQNKRSILDLGIGAGRTTLFFAPLFETYIGVDFSAGMIESCRNRYRSISNAQFIVADVTTLPKLSINRFDFVLFSFNGIDCLQSIEERVALLTEIHSLLEPGGIFAFSSHNTLALKRLYSFQWPRRNPLKIFSEYVRRRKVSRINGPESNYIGKKFFQVYDGGEDFKVHNSYILPSHQLTLLKESGFQRVEAIDIKGKIIPIDKIDSCNDNWIHYLCYKL